MAGTDSVLEVTNLVAGYGRIEVLRQVNLRLARGELVALVGANGAGKTTLLRAISGLLPTKAGSVTLLGQDITRAAPDARVRAGLAQVLEGTFCGRRHPARPKPGGLGDSRGPAGRAGG